MDVLLPQKYMYSVHGIVRRLFKNIRSKSAKGTNNKSVTLYVHGGKPLSKKYVRHH